MIEELKEVRDALAAYNTSSTVKHPLIREHGIRALATIDRIISDHIPDDSKMVVPDGYALVPIEPTKEMIWSGIENTEEFVNGDPWYGSEPLSDGQAEQCYKAMLSAAPQPPTKGGI